MSRDSRDPVTISDDWTRNWQASIAVKITAFVLWVIIAVVLLVATWLLGNLHDRLEARYAAQADRLAYCVGLALAEAGGGQPVTLQARLRDCAGQSEFRSVRVRVGDLDVTLGGNDGAAGQTLRRELPLLLPAQSVSLEMTHPDLDAEVRTQRGRVVMGVFLVLLLFGLFLTWAIRTMVHRPLAQLVNATRAVSQGYADVRLDGSRQDEFGHLSRFFNAMLDRLMAQQRDLRRAADQAQSASRAKSAFLANMSHELRTPLNAIIGYSEMLQEDAERIGAQSCVDDLKKIHAAGRHLLTLINDVLDLSRIEAGKAEVSQGLFSLPALIEEVRDTVAPLIAEGGNRFELDIADAPERMLQDAVKVKQILINLLSNAARCTRKGEVRLAVREEEWHNRPWVEFEVIDTGCGIAPEHLPRLFEEFSRIPSSCGGNSGGTGLGLAITRRHVELLGGEIGVDSEPGRGSRFRVRLPREYQGIELGSLPLSPAAERPSGTANRSVLVVEEDAFLRDLFRRYLVAEGYEVKTAGTLEKALRVAERLHPDVLLVDPDMDKGRGLRLLDALAERRDLARIPVILITGSGHWLKQPPAGVNGVLAKPLDRTRLAEAVGLALERRSSGRRVLIVDDNPATRELLRRTLEEEGAEVQEAEDGETALELLATAPPDLLLLDLVLPGLNGFELLDRLTGEARVPGMRTVVMTAMTLDSREAEQLTARVDQIIEKGVDLRGRVAELARRYLAEAA